MSLTRLLSMKKGYDTHSLKKYYLTADLPAMFLTVLLGLSSLFLKKASIGGWFHMKMTFVVLLIVVDIITASLLFKSPLKNRKIFITLHILVLVFLFLILCSICVLKK